MSDPAGHARFLYRLTRSLHEAPDWREAVSIAGAEVASLATGSTVLIFLLDAEAEEIRCVYSSPEGGLQGKTVRPDQQADLLVQALGGEEPRLFERRRLTQESVQHLKWDSREVPESLTVIPLRHRGRSVGALELAGTAPQPGQPAADAGLLQEIGALLGSSLALLRGRQDRGLGQLEALTRLTQLYDLGRTFHSTLEIDELLPLISNRIANILPAEQCNVWLAESDGSLSCVASWGPAAEAVNGTALAREAGLAGQVLATGAEMVVSGGTAAAELLSGRPEAEAGMEIRSAAAVPLEAKERILGVLEVINPHGGGRFTPADLPFLRDLASQAAVALHNARLLEAERRVGQLGALLDISREATSTLDLGRVLAAVVNRGSTLLPYERAAIALREGKRIRVVAVSGVLEVDPKAEEVLVLSEVVQWAAEQEGGVYLSEVEGEIVTDLPGAREKLADYFRRAGMKSFLSFPLSDEEGNLGVLTMESSVPYFLSESQLEVAEILAVQATVAIRNARLYQQVPLISVMEPWMRKRRAWQRLPLWKRVAAAAGGVALVAVLALFPWRFRVTGTATVMPVRMIAVSAEVDGTVEKVERREGDRVRPGEVIAVLHDPDTRMALAQARADLDIARRERSRLEASRDFARAQMEAARLAQMEEEVALLDRRLEQGRVRAPAGGVILTPRIEEKVGAMLRRGDVFCQLSEASDPAVELEVPEEEIGQIRIGNRVAVKVAAFPSRTFGGTVYQVGARAEETPDGKFFAVRARVEEGDSLRPGMTGLVKVSAGTHSVGYILFRRPARWIWGKVWPWLP